MTTPHKTSSKPLLVDDGHGLLTLGPDRTVRYWRVADGAELRSISIAHAGELALAADAKMVIVAAASLEILDLDAWALRPSPSSDDGIYKVGVDRRARTVAGSAVSGGTVYYWPDGTFTPGGAMRTQTADAIRDEVSPESVAVSFDGRLLATTHRQGNLVRVWRLPNRGVIGPDGAPLVTRRLHSFGLARGAVSADGRHAVPVGRYIEHPDPPHSTEVRAVATGEPVGRVMTVAGYLNGAAFAPPGDRIALLAGRRKFEMSSPELGLSNRLEIWDFRRGERVFAVETESDPVAASYDAKGERIVVVCRRSEHVLSIRSADGEVLWDSTAGASGQGDVWTGGSVYFAEASAVVVTHLSAAPMNAFDLETGELRYRSDDLILTSARSADGELLAIGTSDGDLSIIRLATGEVDQKLPNHPLVQVGFDDRGSRLVTAARDNTLRVWDLESGESMTLGTKRPGSALGASFLPGAQELVGIAEFNRLDFWDVTSGNRLTPSWYLSGDCRTLDVTADGRYAVTSGHDAQQFIDLEGLSPMGRFRDESDETSASPESLARRELDLEGALLLAELSANRTIDSRIKARALTADEWFERWETFRTRYAEIWPFAEFDAALRDEAGER
jgi:WD40 repeat protein